MWLYRVQFVLRFFVSFLFLTDYEPQSICEHLQYLFALLQNSNRKYIDPSGLVKALGLDTGQQQVKPKIQNVKYFNQQLRSSLLFVGFDSPVITLVMDDVTKVYTPLSASTKSAKAGKCHSFFFHLWRKILVRNHANTGRTCKLHPSLFQCTILWSKFTIK